MNYTYLCVFLSKADWPNLISNYWTTQNMQPDILSGFAIKSNFWTKVKKKLFHILIQFKKVVSDVNLVLPDLCYGKFKFYQVWGQFGCIDYKCHVGGIYTFGRSCFFLSNFSCRFLNPNYFFSNWNYSFSNVLLDMRNLQEQVKKSILLPKIVLTFHCLNKLF